MFKEWWRLRLGDKHLRQWNFKIVFWLLLQCSHSMYSWSAFFFISGVWQTQRKERLIHVLSIPSAFSGVLVWTINENEKNIRFAIKRKRICLDRGKVRKSKMLVWWRNCFALFSLKWKGDFWKHISVVWALRSRQVPGVPSRLGCISLIDSQFLCFIVNSTKTCFLEFLKLL